MKTTILVLILIACSAFVYAQESFNPRDYEDGKIDGRDEAKTIAENGKWLFLGMCGGCFSCGFAYTKEYKTPIRHLNGKSDAYAMGFIDGYLARTRRNNAISAGIGWSAWILIYILIQSK